MKLSSQAVQQTLAQFDAEALPETHPAVPQLIQLFGNHTYFVDGSGLLIVEPVQPTDAGSQQGVVVKLASWSDEGRTNLAPHAPEPTNVIIELKAA